MDNRLQNILHAWKHNTKLSVFKIFYLKKDGKIGYIHASWQFCYNELDLLDSMSHIEKTNEFEKWLLPNSKEIFEYSTVNTI